MRAILKSPGMKGTAESMGGWYKLPAGMPDPCTVTIVEVERESRDIVVKDIFDQRWTVPHWLVNCGYEFMVGGQWVHESDPRILKRWSEIATAPAGEYSESFVGTARKILRRNRSSF